MVQPTDDPPTHSSAGRTTPKPARRRFGGANPLLLAMLALVAPLAWLVATQTRYLSTLTAGLSSIQEYMDAPPRGDPARSVEPSGGAVESPTQRSTSVQWPLWHEMAEAERSAKLEEAFARAAPYGKLLGRHASKFHNVCRDGKEPLLFGKGGEHMVCGPPPDQNSAGGCRFFSFGIRDDPSWDKHMGEEWNCRGFAGDPSIVHPSKLHPAVTFHNVGLKMLRSNAEQRRDPSDEWILVTLPSLRKFLGWDYVDVVKIDCEGCEVSMARDILAEDPSFLDRVGQISIETHATRTWVNTTEELYYYALQFPLLEDAGFKLIWSSVFGCGKYEHDGCMPEMEGKMGMSCGNRPRNKVNKVPIGWSCHDWLWARV